MWQITSKTISCHHKEERRHLTQTTSKCTVLNSLKRKGKGTGCTQSSILSTLNRKGRVQLKTWNVFRWQHVILYEFVFLLVQLLKKHIILWIVSEKGCTSVPGLNWTFWRNCFWWTWYLQLKFFWGFRNSNSHKDCEDQKLWIVCTATYSAYYKHFTWLP